MRSLLGKALLPTGGGSEILLEPGRVLCVDGARSFSPRNPFDDPFRMLIHLVKR